MASQTLQDLINERCCPIRVRAIFEKCIGPEVLNRAVRRDLTAMAALVYVPEKGRTGLEKLADAIYKSVVTRLSSDQNKDLQAPEVRSEAYAFIRDAINTTLLTNTNVSFWKASDPWAYIATQCYQAVIKVLSARRAGGH